MGPEAQLGRRVPTRSRFSLALPFQLGSKGEGCGPLASDALASLSPVRIGQERALPALVRGGPCRSQLAEPSCWLQVLAPGVGSKCWLQVLARGRGRRVWVPSVASGRLGAMRGGIAWTAQIPYLEPQ